MISKKNNRKYSKSNRNWPRSRTIGTVIIWPMPICLSMSIARLNRLNMLVSFLKATEMLQIKRSKSYHMRPCHQIKSKV